MVRERPHGNSKRRRPFDTPTGNRIRSAVQEDRGSPPRDHRKQIPEDMQGGGGHHGALTSLKGGELSGNLRGQLRASQRGRPSGRELGPRTQVASAVPEAKVQGRRKVEHRTLSGSRRVGVRASVATAATA